MGRLTRFLPSLREARVVLARQRHRHLAQLTVQGRGTTLHAEADGQDLYAAVDLALAHLGRQVRRRKERIRARKPRPGRHPRAPLPAGGEDRPAAGAADEVIVRRLGGKPMVVEEAIAALQAGTRPFLVFTNARSRQLNVLHRRPDGQLELVQPPG